MRTAAARDGIFRSGRTLLRALSVSTERAITFLGDTKGANGNDERTNGVEEMRRIAQQLKEHRWSAVAIDFVVVVVGIILALQLNLWAENRKDQALESVYLRRLIEDLAIEQKSMEAAEGFARARIEAVRWLDRLAADPSAAGEDPAKVSWAVETASWRSFPQINAFVYHELQSTGRLTLLRSERLRRSLSEHYAALQHDARVGEDLAAQHRFDAATAGLLHVDELEAIELVAGDYRQLKVAPERAFAVAQAFAQRPAAVAELPGLVQFHTFNLRVIAEMRKRANDIVQQIESSLASGSKSSSSPPQSQP